MEKSNIINKIKSLDEFKRDAFRRRVIASCLSEEFVAKSSEINKKIENIEENTCDIISALEHNKEYYMGWIRKLGQAKIDNLNNERSKEIEKYSKIFEENHKKIENEYERQKKIFEEKEREMIKRIDEEYEFLSHTSNPINDPSYYILEAIKEKGVNPSVITDGKDIDIELGSKLYEYNNKMKEYAKIREGRIEKIREEFKKTRCDLDSKFSELRKKVEEKEKMILEKLNQDYDKKIIDVDLETNNAILAKMHDIDNTIAGLKSKKESAVERFESEIAAMKKDLRSKIESLMQPMSPIPEELISKYIYCRIEIKTPEIKNMQNAETKQNESTIDAGLKREPGKVESAPKIEKRNEGAIESTVTSKDAKDTQKSVPESGLNNEKKILSWSADKERRENIKKKFMILGRYVRTAIYTATLGSVLLLALNDRLNTPITRVDINRTNALNSISNNAKFIKSHVQETDTKKDKAAAKIEEVKTNAKINNIQQSETKTSDAKQYAEYKHLFDSFDVKRQIDEYNASKFKFETQVELFEQYMNEMKPSFGEIFGLSKGKKNAANELLETLKKFGDNLTKEKMDLISNVLADARLYEISELKRYVIQILRTDDNELLGVDPTGKIVPRVPTPKIKHHPQQIQFKIVQQTKTEEQNQPAIDASSGTIKLGIEQIDPKNVKENNAESIDNNLDKQNVQNIDSEANQAEKKDEADSNNVILRSEELVDAIIMCGNNAVVVKVSPGYVPNDDDPVICGKE